MTMHTRLAIWLLASACFSAGAANAQQAPVADSTADRELAAFVEENSYRHAYGMYVEGQKFGWVIESLSLGKWNETDVAIYEDMTFIATLFLGEQEESLFKKRIYYSLEGDGPILAVEIVNLEDGRETRIDVERNGDQMVVETSAAGDVSVRSVESPEETLREMVELKAWLTSAREPGDQHEVISSDFEEAELNLTETMTFRETTQVEWEDEQIEAVKVSVNMMGSVGEMTLLPDGRVVQGVIGGFLEIRSESESEVRSMTDQLVDLFATSSIIVDTDLGDPEMVTKLVLKVTNLGQFEFPVSARQAVDTQNDGSAILTLKEAFLSEQGDPLTNDERDEFLAATTATCSDHPTIIDQAKSIVGASESSREKAEKIAQWVHRNMDAAGASNSNNALQILESKAGDCTEHSLLMVALARAEGIPCREVSGVMYAGEGSHFFAWHAWVEYHDGERWIAIDPTWNEMFVDATHIKFATGTTDLSWTNVVGQIDVQVLEFEQRNSQANEESDR